MLHVFLHGSLFLYFLFFCVCVCVCTKTWRRRGRREEKRLWSVARSIFASQISDHHHHQRRQFTSLLLFPRNEELNGRPSLALVRVRGYALLWVSTSVHRFMSFRSIVLSPVQVLLLYEAYATITLRGTHTASKHASKMPCASFKSNRCLFHLPHATRLGSFPRTYPTPLIPPFCLSSLSLMAPHSLTW